VRTGPLYGHECDLIEAGLNEPPPRRATAEFKAVFDDRQGASDVVASVAPLTGRDAQRPSNHLKNGKRLTTLLPKTKEHSLLPPVETDG
jgi:hypothetical protein